MSITIVPAAGEGSRFKKAGYLDLKPSILIANNPIIYWSLLGNKNSVLSDRTVIITKNSDLKTISKSVYESNKKLNIKNLEIIGINKPTNGPAETIAQFLLASDLESDTTSPVYCLDSDMFLLFNSAIFSWGPKKESYVVTGESNHPQHCYLNIDNNKIISISEKEKTSNLAIVGCYVFKSPDIYLNLYKKAKQNLKNNKEFYISDVIKESINSGTCGYTIAQKYLSMGTPEEAKMSEPQLKKLFNFN